MTTRGCVSCGCPAPAWDLITSTTQGTGLKDSLVIGAILVGHDGRRGYVYHTSVDPELRHRNIGTQLVEASLSALRALKINKVALVAFGRNEGGNLFWERQGFSVRDDLGTRRTSA